MRMGESPETAPRAAAAAPPLATDVQPDVRFYSADLVQDIVALLLERQ